jgi:glycosyltransferase involved in cell wall biosynthesis
MKFSIVTPNYNYGSYLEDAIQSVLSQKVEGIEVEHIVIDAESTDDSLDVIRRHPHLKWISEKDKGMSDGINKGFRMATGDWMMWLNADDVLLPNTLLKISRFIEEHQGAYDVVYGDCVFVDGDLKRIRRKFDHRFDSFVLIWGGCFISSTTCFYNRTIIDAGHLIDVDYGVCMDHEFYVRLHRHGYKFGYLPDELALFRWHGSNISAVFIQRRINERRQVQRDYLKRKGLGFLAIKPFLIPMHYLGMSKRVVRKAVERTCRKLFGQNY